VQARLKLADEGISDGQLARCILKGLPKAYESYRAVSLFSTVKFPDLDDMKASCLNIEAEQRRVDDAEAVMLAVTGGKRQDADTGSGVVCWYCTEPGHLKAKCPVKKGADKMKADRDEEHRRSKPKDEEYRKSKPRDERPQDIM
jgi:hypothetical protein